MRNLKIFLFFLIPLSVNAEDLSPSEIIEKALKVQNYGFEKGSAKIKIEIIDDTGMKRERVISSITEKKNGNRKTKILFLEPADVRGTTLLILEENGESTQYLYLPDLKKVRQIAGGEKEQSFMGSDFTYADLEWKDIKEAKYERMEDEKIGGRECYKIKAIPLENEIYKYLEVNIDKKTFLVLKVIFFDKKREILKVFFVRQIKKEKGNYIITKAEMKNEKKKTETRIEVLSFNQEEIFPSHLFEPSNLGK